MDVRACVNQSGVKTDCLVILMKLSGNTKWKGSAAVLPLADGARGSVVIANGIAWPAVRNYREHL